MQNGNLFSHILTPIDGSETSIRAGRMAIQLAGIHGSEITFAYVVDSTTVAEIAGATSRPPETAHRDLENTGKRYLDYLARMGDERGVRSQRVTRSGIPHSEIADLARERDVDLIVIGRVGCRGPRCILIGSVAERVIEHAHCPVLVVTQDSSRR